MFLIILLVLAIFSLLVIAHEFGHFIVAKRNGIKVHEFGIGFPPRLWGKKKGDTLYSINLLPLGGFVRLEGEDNESKSQRSFAVKPLRVQARVLMAGVAMNALIAYIILVGLAATGLPQIFPFDLPRVGLIAPISAEAPRLVVFSVGKESAAAKSDIAVGDEIVSINGQKLNSESELRAFTQSRGGQTVELISKRGSQTSTKSITLGEDKEKGILGVVALSQERQKYAWWAAPIAALFLMGQTIIATVTAFAGAIATLLLRFKVADTVVGPVGVTAVFGQVIRFGSDYVLALVASISTSLAVINALPLPALDGGRLFLLSLRRIGVPVSEKLEVIINLAGFVALIIFGIIIAISDKARFF
ncbi:site-2 protease family protein [Candidatus Saccharibacteria bacterium]|nr:site-2 protease family protein [Candidatus Saccharibacteria bacterium]